MRSYHGLSVLAAATLMVAAPAVSAAQAPDSDFSILPFLTTKRRVSAQAPARFKRGKSAMCKRARKPNRLHISKRVRRAHRRAA